MTDPERDRPIPLTLEELCALVIVKESPETQEVIRLTDLPMVLGSVSAADVQLDGPDIAPEHAIIERVNGDMMIRNVSPSGKTFCNEEQLVGNSPRKLQHGDEIRLGDSCVLRFGVIRLDD
jgi:predicted component of type VI protein secretion system